jgi:hypothetical protein
MSSLAWSANAKLEPLPARLRQLLLGLGQPVRHPHLAQHRDRRRQLGAGLFEAARAAVELAEAEVAVGLEGAHPQLLCGAEFSQLPLLGHVVREVGLLAVLTWLPARHWRPASGSIPLSRAAA